MTESDNPITVKSCADEVVCAVVVTHNRLSLLKECIKALRSQTRRPDRILIVNNGSTDGTAEWLRRQSDLGVLHQDNLGASGGFHHGMKRAVEEGCHRVWVMDDDVLPHAECLASLCLAIDSLGRDSIVLPCRLTPDGAPLHAERVRIDYSTYLKDDGPVRIRDIWKNHTHAHPLRVEGFTFEGPMFPGTVAQRVGLPDMNYFLIGDDTDYAIRCKPHYQVFYIPTALATRQLPEKTEGSITLKDYYLIRNAYTFMALKYGVFPSKYIRPIVRCLAFARNRFVLHKVPITLSGLALLLRGIIDGYLGRLGRIN